MSHEKSVIDLLSLKHLRIQDTEVANVWRVSLPTKPWKFGNAEQERDSLVTRLSEAFPYRALWLSDWASEDSPGWKLLDRNASLSSLVDELSKGGWVLFFFDRNPSASLDATFVPAEPADAAAAIGALRDFGATAAIWSWYDDNEWLIAIADPKYLGSE